MGVINYMDIIGILLISLSIVLIAIGCFWKE
nr:MAG TPA: GRB2-binding adapter (GAPT) [Caudoviricetes sp.]